jgi:hypothetical protein
MTQHAVQMVQRNVTPRGDKNGADINLALDALEMAFTRHHINAFAVVGGDSDFIALVEKLKQYDKRVFVVGGREFTSNILQRNCTEFIAYENLLRSGSGDGARGARSSRRAGPSARTGLEARPLSEALSNVQRALKILADRAVAPQIGLLKSTLLQLDSTFTERDFGAGSFLEFMQKMERARLVHLRRTDRGFLVEPADGEGERKAPESSEAGAGPEAPEPPPVEGVPQEAAPPASMEQVSSSPEAMDVLRQGLAAASQKVPNRPLYLRQIRQALRSADKNFDERRYGLRGVLDLLHHAQREGWVRLQRDRKGVLRIFAVGSTPPAPSPAATEETLAAPSTAVADPEAGIAEAIPAPEDITALDAALPAVSLQALEPAGETGAATGQRIRKSRVAGSPGKGMRRRASTRRKPKEPTQD